MNATDRRVCVDNKFSFRNSCLYSNQKIIAIFRNCCLTGASVILVQAIVHLVPPYEYAYIGHEIMSSGKHVLKLCTQF